MPRAARPPTIFHRVGDMKAWIDKVGLAPEDVIIVDLKGDLPFAPGVADYIGAGVKNRGDLAGVISDILSNNAYNDYGATPSDKFSYVQLIEGDYIGKGPIEAHSAGIKGGFDKDGNISRERMYKAKVNGSILEKKFSVIDLYKDFLSK